MYQLEQDLINLETQKSFLETENIIKSLKQQSLEAELDNLKRIREEETMEKKIKTKETANEVLQRISKLKAHVIKCKEEFDALKQ